MVTTFITDIPIVNTGSVTLGRIIVSLFFFYIYLHFIDVKYLSDW